MFNYKIILQNNRDLIDQIPAEAMISWRSKMDKKVNEYLKSLDPERQESLKKLRTLVLKTTNGIKESMLYRMPTFEYNGRVICAFTSQKNYMSFYIMNTNIVNKYIKELGKLSGGISCIRFKRLEELPIDVIKVILKESLQPNKVGR
jgi:uncharacterized protein YdhG (YjbR/CyaY superfamily)